MPVNYSAMLIGSSSRWESSSNPTVPQGQMYYHDAIQEILSQNGCVSVGTQARVFIDTSSGKAVKYDRYFMVGKDSSGNWLQGEQHLVAIPCPDMCNIN